jgi:hypothetical protein
MLRHLPTFTTPAAAHLRVNPTLAAFYPHARVRSSGFMRYFRYLATFLLHAALPLVGAWRRSRQGTEDGGELALMWEYHLQMRQALSRLMRAAGSRSWPRTSAVPMPMAAQVAQVRRAARKLWRNVSCSALRSPAARARRDT